MKDVNVTIIGGGISGLSTAYNLAQQSIEVLVIEAGEIGIGSGDFPSGTASLALPPHSKMLTTPYDSDFETVTEKHGEEGAALYQTLMHYGLDWIKSFSQNDPSLVRNLGSIVVALKGESFRLRNEQENYKSIGFGQGLRQVGLDEIVQLFNCSPNVFEEGLLFPNDASVNLKSLLQILADDSNIALAEHTKAVSIKQDKYGVTVQTLGKGQVRSEYAVIATNGFSPRKNVKGLIQPYWTFQLAFQDEGKNTPNAWTFEERYHYFMRQDGTLIVGGEDAVAQKYNDRFMVPEENLTRLEKWANEAFPSTKGNKPLEQHYGIFAKTADQLPIVGTFSEQDRIAYIIGCNAVGMTLLTGASRIMPQILGYAPHDEKTKMLGDYLSPSRVTLAKF